MENLAADPKNLAENLMITDMVRNDLGRICKRDSISARILLMYLIIMRRLARKE